MHGSFHVKNTFWTPISDRFVNHAGNYGTRVEFTRQLYSVPKSLTHKRTFENFSKSNLDRKVKIPPQHGAVRWAASLGKR